MNSCDLDDVCAVVGYTATRKLAAWHSARKMYVPVEFRSDHPLCLLIGESAARRLIAEFPGDSLNVPPSTEDSRYRRDRVIAEMLCKGASNDAIAGMFELTTRRVEAIREELEENGWLVYAGASRSRLRGRPSGGQLPTPALFTEI